MMLVALLAMTTGAWAQETQPQKVTIAQFLAAEVSDVVYELTGTVSNIKNTTYGNFDLTDATGTVYVYGLLTAEGVSKQFASMGIEEGTNITITAPRSDFQGTPQAKNAILKSINPVELSSDVIIDNTLEQPTATFGMPAYDATVVYDLVRDLTKSVVFNGIPTEPVVVKKDDDGKYIFGGEIPTVTLDDVLNAEQPQTLFSFDGGAPVIADGIHISIEQKGENDAWTDVTATFIANILPGTYRFVASPVDETSPYDGIVESAEFTLVEKYELAIQPANEFSKGQLESVTVAGEAVTLDDEGKAKVAADPKDKVILKAKRGYVIDQVEVKKTETKVEITVDDVTLDITGCLTWVEVVAKNSDKIECPGNGVKKLGTSYFLTYKSNEQRVVKTEAPKADEEYYWKLGE